MVYIKVKQILFIINKCTSFFCSIQFYSSIIKFNIVFFYNILKIAYLANYMVTLALILKLFDFGTYIYNAYLFYLFYNANMNVITINQIF